MSFASLINIHKYRLSKAGFQKDDAFQEYKFTNTNVQTGYTKCSISDFSISIYFFYQFASLLINETLRKRKAVWTIAKGISQGSINQGTSPLC